VTKKKLAAKKFIIDDDFDFFSADTAPAILALQSADVEVLGLTVVHGNFDMAQSTENILRGLELMGRGDVPVYAGADRPLIHQRGAYERGTWGRWATLGDPEPPGGTFAKIRPSPVHAVDFIIESITEQPHQVTIVAIGPLTNLAIALRKAPKIAEQVGEVVIMGGAIPALPGGHGNHTPTAEFNFWVDPEAAFIVLRSGMPILLCPLNVTRKSKFEREDYEQIERSSAPQAKMFHQRMGRIFGDPALEAIRKAYHEYMLCDVTAVAAAIDRSLVKTVSMLVDIDLSHGPSYGTSWGYLIGDYEQAAKTPWAFDGVYQPMHLGPHGTDDPKPIDVAYDIDVEALKALFLQAMTDPLRPGKGSTSSQET
jgi:inosine-uridine nucleoside N-ribohydrolase